MKNSRKTQMAILAIVSLLVFGGILMSAVSFPYTLTNGTMADADQVMANFTALSSSFGDLAGNYIPFWSGIDKKFMDSGIYWNGSNVGIGTITPSAKLHVEGDIKLSYGYYYMVGAYNALGWNSGTGSVEIGSAGASLRLMAGSIDPRLYINDTTGNVGIGTTTPRTLLDIRGNDQDISITQTNGLLSCQLGSYASGEGALVVYDSTEAIKILLRGGTSPSYINVDNFGIGTTSPLAGLHVDKIAEAGLSETISRFSVSDDPANFLQISNGTSTNNLYLPKIYAYAANTSETALTIEANCGNNDALPIPVTVFNSLSNSGTVVVRPLFDFRNDGASKMIIAANGNVGIGTTSPGFRLQVGEGSNYGYVSATGVWVNSSDIRFKENVKSLSSKTCLDKVSGINAIEYNVVGDDKRQIGFSAQDIERIIPEIVSTDINGYKGVGYASITPILVEAIKELKNENDLLKEENNQLSIRLRLVEEKLGIK